MRRFVLGVSVLPGLVAADHAAWAQTCNVCAEQRAACMKNYAGPACKTEYQMCVKSYKNKASALDNLLLRCLFAALATGIGGFGVLDAGFVVADSLRKLSGAQIRTKFAGMQLTDEVHYRFVYERDG